MNRNVEFDSLQMGVTQVAGNRIADCLSSQRWEQKSDFRLGKEKLVEEKLDRRMLHCVGEMNEQR